MQTLDELATNKISESSNVFEPLIEVTNELLKSTNNFAELKQLVERKLVSQQFIQSLAEKLVSGIHAADAIGRSCVVQKDKFFSDEKKKVSAKFKIGKFFSRADGMQWIAAAGKDNRLISYDLALLQALQSFQRKAFWISGIENQQFINNVKFVLENAILLGTSYEDFSNSFKDLYEKWGVTTDSPFRLDTIFRTNLFSAYTAGQVKQVEDVRNRFPVWRWIQIQDNRRNEYHIPLHDKYFRYGPYPPIWYNDRCTPQFIHIYQLERLGDIQIFDSVYDFLETDKVVDFGNSNSFDSWIDENPVSSGIKTIVEEGLK